MRTIFMFLILTLGCASASCLAQTDKSKTYTISGYVVDSKSKETLLNASVYDANTLKGAITNDFGYYTLVLPAGPVSLQASYVGYSKFESEFELSGDTIVNIKLDATVALQEVTVLGRMIDNNVTGTQMGTVEIPVLQMKRIPAIFGETDIIKALQLLPGVQSGTEGSAGMYVRGGGPDENLILLDGVPLYNVNHAMGFFSAFNPDAIKNVTLYKGNFPARFGGRLSSVIDVRTKDGDMQAYHGNFSIGLIAARLNVEGPIVKDKTSFNFSFRRTYYDLLSAPIVNMVTKSELGKDGKSWAGYYFYDLNLKLNHKFSDKDRLFLSLYSGDDRVYANFLDKENTEYDGFVSQTSEKMKAKWRWGNRIAALRWNHVISPKLFMNVTGAYTQYRHLLDVSISDESVITSPNEPVSGFSEQFNQSMNSGIFDWNGNVDFDYKPHENHDVRFGLGLTHHDYRPSSASMHIKREAQSMVEYQYDTVVGDARIGAWETDLYAEDNWNINRILRLSVGLHYSNFFVNGKGYHSLQPRVSMRLLATEDLSFKAGYAAMTQYVHLLSNNSISLPTDLWVPVTDRILPMRAHQVSVGAFYNWKGFELSLEGYYKRMSNVIEYKDGASFFSFRASDWQEKVVMGDGYSYGVEFLAQRTIGKLTGWVGYTWARANRLFNRPGQELNFGKVFPAKYDRRHDLNIVLSYAPSERFDVSATWVYSSGNCATFPLQIYHDFGEGGSFYVLDHVSQRNNYRFNSYQRLDIGLNWHKQKKHGMRTWSLNVYNTLCHNNPFFVIPRTDSYYDQTTQQFKDNVVLKQVCIFPIMPSLSYSFQF